MRRDSAKNDEAFEARCAALRPPSGARSRLCREPRQRRELRPPPLPPSRRKHPERLEEGKPITRGQDGGVSIALRSRGAEPRHAPPFCEPGRPLLHRYGVRRPMTSERTQFLEAAAAIGADLCRDAIWDGPRCNWLGDSMEPLLG